VTRSEFYKRAIMSLGVRGLARRQLARRFGRGDMLLTSRESRFPVRARRGSSDVFVFDQIFVDREYRCLEGMENVRTIVDAGANVGYSSAWLLSRFPDANVVAIEPDPRNFDLLARNLAPFGNRAALFRGALWSGDTTLDFGDAFRAEGDEWARQVGVAAVSMPTLIERYGLETIDILKIDIEGAETAVFNAPDLSWMDRVGAIVIELHGPECEAALGRAIAGRGYVVSRCEELTVCLR
jgi:FkbM family methyltransferase